MACVMQLSGLVISARGSGFPKSVLSRSRIFKQRAPHLATSRTVCTILGNMFHNRSKRKGTNEIIMRSKLSKCSPRDAPSTRRYIVLFIVGFYKKLIVGKRGREMCSVSNMVETRQPGLPSVFELMLCNSSVD